jgi:hypothetical protein
MCRVRGDVARLRLRLHPVATSRVVCVCALLTDGGLLVSTCAADVLLLLRGFSDLGPEERAFLLHDDIFVRLVDVFALDLSDKVRDVVLCCPVLSCVAMDCPPCICRPALGVASPADVRRGMLSSPLSLRRGNTSSWACRSSSPC